MKQSEMKDLIRAEGKNTSLREKRFFIPLRYIQNDGRKERCATFRMTGGEGKRIYRNASTSSVVRGMRLPNRRVPVSVMR